MYLVDFENDKRFKNKICQECIARNIRKYGSFECVCKGITIEQDVKAAMKQGFTEEEARFTLDPAYFFEKIYGSKPRWYQYRLLYCTAKQLVARQCRQTGKTLVLMYKVFHYLYTNENSVVIIVLPSEKQIKEMWDKYVNRDFINKSPEILDSVESKAMSPSYEVKFTNGSKLVLAIASPNLRGFTGAWLYIDEAALIAKEAFNAILMTIASAEDYTLMMSSTPMGRGNAFYKECKESPTTNEYHVSIYEVDEMKDKIPFFKELLGETGFIQECEAEFPDVSGGPFNYRGIDLAKQDYRYKEIGREPGWIYLGGVDWNGPGVGTYFTIIGFHPDTYTVRVFDFQIISSANWNSTAAKEMFRHLNEKWRPKHWLVDAGYGHSIVEDLMLTSLHAQRGTPDAEIKYILEKIDFGSFMEVEDPFTGELNKKMTKNFMVSQLAKLFEIRDNTVHFQYSKYHDDLTKSLEGYKLLSITDRGIEKYGFDKNDDMEDHCYTPDHEFLTKKGWKSVSKITLEDELAVPDEFGIIRYEKPSRVIAKEYDGITYEINNNYLSFKVTDEHLIPFYKNREIFRSTVGDLKPTSYIPIFSHGLASIEDYEINDEKIFKIGFNITKPKSTDIRRGKIGFKLVEFYSNIFDNVNSPESNILEEIPRELLNYLSVRQLRILVDGIFTGRTGNGKVPGDYYKPFKTRSRRMVENLQEIFFKIGIKYKLDFPKNKDPYYLFSNFSTEESSMIWKSDIIKSEYKGMVYCATVSTGLLVIRRNFRVSIGSNCIDSLMCAVHGITKHYSELFKRIAYGTVFFDGREVLAPPNKNDVVKIPRGSTVTLLTDSHKDSIENDEGANPTAGTAYVSRTFDKSIAKRQSGSLRTQPLIKRTNFNSGARNDTSFSRRTTFH